MCGIAGSIGYPNEVVLNILQHQKKRGPDTLNIVKSNVSFGHNLLAIIGHQEQPLEGERYLLTYNGEWYNFRDFYNISSDSIALLRHIERLGLKAIDDVNGMFAIGLYDKIEQKIHLLVDRFGQKPLYYYHEKGKFAFASSPGALYQLKDKWDIDKDALHSYWLLGSVMGNDGLLKGIKKVTASEIVTYDVRSDNVITKRYYEPKFQENTKDIEDVVLDAIRKVKVSDVPVHIFLSGGIDSTLVASQFEGGQAIHLDSPEYIYAKQAADRFHVELKRVYPQDIEVESNLRDFALQAGEPCMAALIPYITAKEVSKFGRVAITANGADELFFGYDRMQHSYKQFSHIMRESAFGDFQPFVEYKAAGISTKQFFELKYYVQYDLNKTLDFASMCHSLEVRSPFLDHRLVEMALSIPESVHRKQGNKTILKNMLRRFGFQDHFLNRAKIGFSIHKEPKDLQREIKDAWRWVISNEFLIVDEKKLNGRDLRYLEMSALSFYYWYLVWEHKIK
jgi:asparagine synthase (glutamine-hydrolysing)